MEMIRIARYLNLNPNNPKSWPKETMFNLLDIKIHRGHDAMKEEVNNMLMKQWRRNSK